MRLFRNPTKALDSDWMNMMTQHPATSPILPQKLVHAGRILTVLFMIISAHLLLGPVQAFPESPVLSWDSNEDADYYQVYMRSEGEKEYTLVSGRIPSGTTSFKLMPSPGGAIHYFTVKAFNTCGNSSDFSDEIPSAHIPYDPLMNTVPVTKNSGTTPTLPEPLSLEIILPEDGAFVTAGTSLEFSANVFRGDTLHTDYMVTWTSSIDGYLGTGLDIAAVLSPGVHIVMAASTDETGDTASATLLLYVQEPNTAPDVRIVQAQGGDLGTSGQAFNFKATAVDRPDGDLGAKIVWTSSKSGRLGTGASILATLPPGTHIITASVLDSGGLEGKASLTVTVAAYNHPPQLVPGVHDSGILEKTGQSHTFRATASDVEDGDISALITWNSDIGGYLGTGAQVMTRLSSGEHTITASVTDSRGETVSRTMEISVGVFNTTPVLTLGTPVEKGVNSTGKIYNFTASASDAEDGSLNSLIIWSSDKDGYLGTGAAITCSLSPGVHTITASVNDSLGKTASKTLAVTVAAPNGAPVVSITGSTPGVLDASGQSYSFSAKAADQEDGDISHSILWASSRDGNLGQGASIAPTLSSGVHTITASVSDSQGSAVSASVQVTVAVFDTPPTVTIQSVTAGALNQAGHHHTFKGSASDSEDGDLSQAITWTSTHDGYLGKGASIEAALSAGSHIITATVSDSKGKSANTARHVTAALYNAPPQISISALNAGLSHSKGQNFTLTASATDSEDGNLGTAITWTSSMGGTLGTGSPVTVSLSPGSHTITANVTDSQGKTATASRTVTAVASNSPPSASILSISQGTLTAAGQPCIFKGSATDPEDGDLGSVIAWTSSLDGPLGTGATLTRTLSSGQHLIKARVTDKGGKTAEASKTITVAVFNHPPVVTPISFLKGAALGTGQTYTFASSASDREDGDLSTSILWSSSLSGSLGKGASIQAVLKPGVHVVTAKAADKGGKTASATKTLSVESVNLLPSVQILQVSPGAAGSEGQLFELTGTALDEEDGNLTHTLAWSSSLDGPLGQGSPVVATLRAGTHALTARACDKRGGCASVSRSVTVVPFNNPPSVEIVSVVGSRQDTKGQAFELKGKAADREEGVLSRQIVWTSSIDGRLGQGEVVKPRLSHGTHTITAKVKDSKGKESSKTVTVNSFKASRLELSVSTKRIFSLRQVKVSWKGGSSGVDIAMDGVKVDSGPNQGSRYYWSRKKTRIKVSDSLNPSVSVTRTTK